VSGVYFSPIGGEPRVAVGLPVTGAANESLLLAITVPTNRIYEAIPSLPAGWVIGIGDKAKNIVARSQRHEELSGKSGRMEFFTKSVGRSGAFSAVSIEGMPVLAGYYNSPFSDWVFVAVVPDRIVEEPLRRSIWALVIVGALSFAVSVLLSFWFGRAFTAASKDLTENALALGRGRPVMPLRSGVSEFKAIGEALTAASMELESRARARAEVEEQRQLLIDELNHRVKNTLAVVQSLLAHTLRDASSIADARARFENRLQALAAAHDVLTRESWRGAGLEDILRAVTAAFAQGDRILLQGPPVRLYPGAAVAFAMVLNELTTNAAKYGSLSMADGRVLVEWTVTPAALLRLGWREIGGPTVSLPSRRGFGSVLVENNLRAFKGKADLVYDAAGLHCHLELPIERTSES
jgi:two-component sensor histidine kinase